VTNLRVPWPLLLLLLPATEIAGFIVVGQKIGVLATLALILATFVLGLVLLRIQGFGILSRIREESERGIVPGREMIHAAMVMVAGFLLLLPGFLTDLIGLLLFLPFVRDFGWRMLRAKFAPVAGNATRPAPVIDLDRDEYGSAPRPDSPWREDQGR
jgi:UPF0716 protein FxsA